MKIRSIVLLAASCVVAAGLFFACDQNTGNTDTTEPAMEVGDVLAGGFEVTRVDAEGGYLATRDWDGDDDGTVDERQTMVSGRFTSDLEFTSDRVYILKDAVFIGNDNSGNCELSIAAGTTIKGEVSTTAPGVLVITRGSTINAVGTASAPIVFTSAVAEGGRAAGNWGGIVINGNARINDGDDNGEAEGEGSTGKYGGDDDSDSSGTLQYVRVEFAGTLFSPDNELNGIAFQGVGNGTTVDHIQVHRNADDGVEFFGGCVNVSYLVITGAGDDSLDWTSGWTGSADHVILQQYDGMGDCGIEADSNKNDASAEPVSNPTLSNFTIIGRSDSDEIALQFRRGTNVTLQNSIITGFSTNCNESSKSSDAGTLTFDGVLVDAASTVAASDDTDWSAALTAGTVSEAATLNLPAGALAGGNTGSVSVKPSSAIDADGVSLNSVSGYFGAIDPSASSAWYAGWTDTPAN